MAKAPRYGDFRPDEPRRALSDAVLRALWGAVFAEAEGAMSGADAEAIHDMRVAIRRLRSALRTFGSCYPEEALRGVAKRVKRLGRALGGVRDADVHLEALRSAVATVPEAERDGVAFAVEQVGEQRGIALTHVALVLTHFERDALELMLAHE